MTSNYIPGVCNINTAEIKQRRAAGHIGLAATVAMLVALVVLDVTPWARVIVFLPALLAASGYLQARNKFCVGYGGSGLQHADNDDAAVKVAADAAAKDKKRTQQINQQTFFVALLVTAVAVLLPV